MKRKFDKARSECGATANKFSLVLALIIFSVHFPSCGTIRYGVTQKVGIASSPLGASVIVDDKPYGETPLLLHLSRIRNHRVRIELPGHLPYETVIDSRIRGSELATHSIYTVEMLSCVPCVLLFLPFWVVSLGVDAVSGGLYDLSPDQIVVPLEEE